MESREPALQEKSYGIVTPTVARLLADAEKTTDIHKKLELLLRASVIGNAIVEQSAEPRSKGTLSVPESAEILKGLLYHCAGDLWNIASEYEDLVRQVITDVKQDADENITRMLAAYDDVDLIKKTFTVCVVFISVKERPERNIEVIDAILRTWDRETDHIKRATLKLLSTAAWKSATIADEGFKVALRGLEDTDPSIRVHALQHIVMYARAFLDKTEAVIDAAVAGSNDLSRDVASEAVQQLDELYGKCPEKDWEIASVMLDKYNTVDDRGRVSVAIHLADFVRNCPERLDEIYATAMRAFGDEDCSVKAAVIGQLVGLIKFCPDKESEIISLVLSTSGDEEDLDVLECGVDQLANLVKACPRNAERIIDDMIQQCKNDWCVNYGVLNRIGEVIALCPTKAEENTAAVLHWCRYDYYQEVAAATGNTRETVVAAVKEKKALDNYSVDPHEIHRSAKEEAMSQLGRSGSVLPERAAEFLNLAISGWEYECHCVKAAAINQMGSMVELCPEKADQIIKAVVTACGDEWRSLRSAGMCQLPSLARACPERTGQFVDLLCGGCHDSDDSVKIAAAGQLVKMMQVCPSKARKLFGALLCCCGDEREYVNQKAKKQVEAALRLCPEFASDVVQAMIQRRKEADSESRKRQTCIECPCAQAKAPRLS